MIYYIKQALTNPKEIYVGRNMKNSHFLSIILLLATTLTFISFFDFFPILRTMSEDITEVKQAIPDFTLENNQLESSSESFIYQTDTMLFYFDPDEKISNNTIIRNTKSVSVPVSVGLLKDELVLDVVSQNFSLEYARLANFTTDELKDLIENFGQISPPLLIFLFLFLIIYNLIMYIVQFFPIVLFSNIISVYRRTGLRFSQTTKIALLATILPILGIYIVNTLLFNVYYQLEILIVSSVFLYYLSMSEVKTRMQNPSDKNK